MPALFPVVHVHKPRQAPGCTEGSEASTISTSCLFISNRTCVRNPTLRAAQGTCKTASGTIFQSYIPVCSQAPWAPVCTCTFRGRREKQRLSTSCLIPIVHVFASLAGNVTRLLLVPILIAAGLSNRACSHRPQAQGCTESAGRELDKTTSRSM
jgi:hypothetical protein